MGILRYYLVVLLAYSFALPALASVINFQSTHIGGGATWRYDYMMDNAGGGVPIEEWTIYFDRDRYSNLKNIADVPQWDVLAGTAVRPPGALVVRHDRTFPFSLASLSWAVEAEPNAMLNDLDHAEVYVIPLSGLGISLPATSVSATGAVREARIVDGSLRFWTPGDPGYDEYGNFLVHTGSGATSLTALIRSQRPTRVATVIEAMENGVLPAQWPRLNVEGLGANNSLTGGPLTFRLASNPGGDLKDDSRAELVAAGNSVIALQDY